MEEKHILSVQLFAPEFFMRSNFPDYKEEHPINPDFNSIDFSKTDALKFGLNKWGIHATLESLFPGGFPLWTVLDLEGVKKQYLNQVVLPSYGFLKKTFEDMNEGLQNLRKYMTRSKENDWFGLEDNLRFEKNNFEWKLFDSFYLRGDRSSLTSALLKFRDVPDEALNEQARKYKSLSRHVIAGKKGGVNYFGQDSLQGCIHVATNVYEVANDFK